MAIRNSLKATLLLEAEQPRSRLPYDFEPAALVDEAAPPIERPPAAEPVPAPAIAPETAAAALWRARAEELRDRADTLPSNTSRPLLRKIADLYDELADEAAAAHPLEEPPAQEKPEPRATGPLVHPRRPLPGMRRFARRRA